LNLRYAKLSKPFYQEKAKFTLVKDQESIELTMTDHQKAYSCFLEMRKFCVLIDFHQRYEIIDIIEEGKNSCVIFTEREKRNFPLDLFGQVKNRRKVFYCQSL